ncbi:LuxR family transcriptional regulator [Streptomyces sp. CB01881]|uniref:helix-turn-helix transcriptional regulator n=1 Tax=Streptomyces sp. CB01881 TaxID=2078691 RepID=UPI000CDC9EEB|nr:LuxR family transcriptional regulator [Streptomyces sp. CB01881]AUY50657.1 LuxR family transcriptional regulator [Streptomyces sp. CB01881]TYC74043.1 helix-turn-helix transcriptional regulator [Streptomyces sp. CB01881]
MSTDRIITLHGEEELVRLAGHLFVGSREEFLVAAADLVTWSTGVNAAFREGKRPHVVPGLTMRKLYTRRAMADPESVRRLLRIAASGIEVRICDGPLAREAIIIDRRTAILAGAPVRGVRTYTVVHSPEVVDGVRSLFRATWETATDLADCAAPPDLTEQARHILRTLAAGHTDETGARLLGLSLRTYRRRVAEVMTALGATSRFQAGLLAQGLTGEGVSPDDRR